MASTVSRLAQRLASATIGLLVSGAAMAQLAPPPERASGWTHKAPVASERDMVVAAHPLAVRAGAQMLAAGGSAVDAAIAVQMVLTLVEPQSSGIGGGAFLVHWNAAAGKVETYDGRETAPAAVTPELFVDAQGKPMGFAAAQVGGRAVGTPGILAMLELAHREHGRLPWARLFVPAIALAEQGFPISPRLHTAIAGARDALAREPAARAYFLDADGAPKPVGSVLRNPPLATLLRAIAHEGSAAFYRGEVAAEMVAAVRAHARNPGALAQADLASYRAVKRAPVCGGYRGRTLCGIGMPSSGTVTLLMALAMLERFDLAAMGPNSADAVHVIAEAYRLAYADRARYMADADFVAVPVAGLLDPAYAAARAELIDPKRSLGAAPAGRPPGCCAKAARADGWHAPGGGTSHVAIVDAAGNAVSMTTTIESAFGSHLMVRGFLLNNQLTDFSFVPTGPGGEPVANRVEPGKRPRSSMTPVLVFDRAMRLAAVLGSPGGSAIIQYVGKTIIGLYDWNLDIQEAIDLGNFGAQTSRITQLERGTPVAALAAALAARGHEVALVDLNSGLHGITLAGARDEGRRTGYWASVLPGPGLLAGADPRREGVAVGH